MPDGVQKPISVKLLNRCFKARGALKQTPIALVRRFHIAADREPEVRTRSERVDRGGGPARWEVIVALLVLTAAPLLAPSGPAQAPPGTARELHERQPGRADFGRLPLAFEPNEGQTDPRVRFLAHTPAGLLFFTAREVVLALNVPAAGAPAAPGEQPGHPAAPARPEALPDRPPAPVLPPVLRVRFVDASPAVALRSAAALPGRVNYFLGDDPAGWRTAIPTYARVTYAGLYPGIDLEYSGDGGQLKGTYTVAPGADPARIRWRYEGARGVSLAAGGSLRIELAAPDGAAVPQVIEQAPVAWQQAGGQRVPVSARYVLAADGSLGFALGRYDPARPLVLDPIQLVYSTYLGGAGADTGTAVAVDAAGRTYVTGYTSSTNFPLDSPLQPTYGGGGYDAFVTKFNPRGTALVYSTYLGGFGADAGAGIAVDAVGSAYVVGHTGSTNFPLANPLQPAFGGGYNDAFAAKIGVGGAALIYSTYLGGTAEDIGRAVAVDAAENAYLTGYTSSTNFPLANPFQPIFGGTVDGFVAKLRASGAALVYSTYLGGSAWDVGSAIRVDAGGSAYLIGDTGSTNFPLANPYQPAFRGGSTDAFVTKLNWSGAALVYSTYLGGGDTDQGAGIALDGAGSAYLTGWTASANFPLDDPIQPSLGGPNDAFVTQLSPGGAALVYSSYLGGSGADAGRGIGVNLAGSATMTGETYSTNFPLANPLQSVFGGGLTDVFVTKISPGGAALVYSTYLGGAGNDRGLAIAAGPTGSATLAGSTASTNFPLYRPFQNVIGGGTDVFVTRLCFCSSAELPLMLYNR